MFGNERLENFFEIVRSAASGLRNEDGKRGFFVDELLKLVSGNRFEARFAVILIIEAERRGVEREDNSTDDGDNYDEGGRKNDEEFTLDVFSREEY